LEGVPNARRKRAARDGGSAHTIATERRS
jgi:hypothetical protein